MKNNDWYALAKSCEERAHEVDKGVHGYDEKEKRVLELQDLAAIFWKMGHKQEKPFEVVKGQG